jgi:hypothetical protein
VERYNSRGCDNSPGDLLYLVTLRLKENVSSAKVKGSEAVVTINAGGGQQMTDTKEIVSKTERSKGKFARWFENFFLMGGWIVILIAVLLACGAIRSLLNY